MAILTFHFGGHIVEPLRGKQLKRSPPGFHGRFELDRKGANMAGADQVLSQFQQALKSGDDGAINKLVANSKTNLDRGGISAKGPGGKGGPKKASNANVKFQDTITTGDTIVAKFSFDVKGADVEGADPTKTATVNAIAIAKVQNGQVTSVSIEPDTAGLYFQLGLGVADAKKTQ